MSFLSSSKFLMPSDGLQDQLAANAKTVLLTDIKFKEGMYLDEEEQIIKEKYKPINPQYNYSSPLHSSGSNKDCNGTHSESKMNCGFADDMPKPKIVLFPPEKVELNWKEKRKIGPGLCNLGNTCFLNSVLQVLTYSAPLVNFISSDAHRSDCVSVGFCMLCELRNHIFRVLKHNPQAGPIRPLAIVQKLSYIGRQFKFGRQEDAHEFLRYVVEGLQKSCLAGKPKLDKMSKESTVVNQIFGGFYRSQVTCLACKHKSNTYDPMMEMNLDIKEVNSVENALRRSVKPERLDGENRYQCDKCRGKRPAVKRSTIHKSPNVFTVQFKRFDFNRIIGGKISKHVSFSEELNLRPFMSNSEGQPILYNLYAVLVHSGFSCNSGHYYCYVKGPNGIWYEMNDSRVAQVSVKTVLSAEAYLLFYIRKVTQGKKVMNGQSHSKLLPLAHQQNAVNSVQSVDVKNQKKESRSCPKLIPLNFMDKGKVSFKFMKNNTVHPLKEAIKGGRPMSSAGTEDSKKQQNESKAGEKPAIGLGSMEKLREYDSDSSHDENKPSTLNVEQSRNRSMASENSTTKISTQALNVSPIQTRKINGDGTVRSSSVSKSPCVESPLNGSLTKKVESLTVSTDNTKDPKSVTNLKADNKMTKDEQQSSKRTPKEQCMSPHLQKEKCELGEENVTANCSNNHCDNPSQESRFKYETAVERSPEKDETLSETSRPKTSHSFSRSFLFSPPLVPAMRPWMPVRHCSVPRSVFMRSFSEPDACSRKQSRSDHTQTAKSKDCSTKGTKWHAFKRDPFEHLFGPMTPPCKGLGSRERTSSLNSEASSVASVSSKIGDWEVHEKEIEDVTAPQKIPARQFVGWDVLKQGSSDDVTNDSLAHRYLKNTSENGDQCLEEGDEKKKRRTKKRKKKKKKKEQDDEKQPLVLKHCQKSTKRKNQESDFDSDVDGHSKRSKHKSKKSKKDKLSRSLSNVEEDRKKDDNKDKLYSNITIENRTPKPEKSRKTYETSGKSRDECRIVSEEGGKSTRMICTGEGNAVENEHERDESCLNKDVIKKHHMDEQKPPKEHKHDRHKSTHRKHSTSQERSVSKEETISRERRRSHERSSSREGSASGVKESSRHHSSNTARETKKSSKSLERLSNSHLQEEKEALNSRHDSRSEQSITPSPKKRHSFSGSDRKSSKRRRLDGNGGHNTDTDHDSSDSCSRYRRERRKKSAKRRSRGSSEECSDDGRSKLSRTINGHGSRCQRDVLSKDWDDKKCLIPEQTRKSSDIVEALMKDKSRSLGQKVKNWDGEDNELDSTRTPDEKHKRRDKWDEEYDEGKKKKVKSRKSKSKRREFSFNPFQRIQNSRNRKEIDSYQRPRS